MTEPVVLKNIDDRGIATVTINRPDVNNAYNEDVIDGLVDAIVTFSGDPNVRVILLRGNGKHFQAGADLKWINEVAQLPMPEIEVLSQKTTDAVRGLDACPKPTIALIQGGCFGGGVGIAAACDIVIAAEDALFAITEARWGLIATPIFPQLVATMGLRNVRRFALTCERFDAAKAKELGLVQEICAVGELDSTAAPIVESLLQNAPDAVAQSKRQILELSGQLIDDELAAHMSRLHAAKRHTDEAREGLQSFAEKRTASWYFKPGQ